MKRARIISLIGTAGIMLAGLMYAEYRCIMTNIIPQIKNNNTVCLEVFGHVDEYYVEHDYGHIGVVSFENLSLEEIENRNRKLIIERVVGIVDDDKGNGHIIGTDYYISYKNIPDTQKGNTICTYFVYNSATNYIDDIIARYDYIIE